MSIDPDIANFITIDSLDLLKSALKKSHTTDSDFLNRLLALAITNNSHATIPHLNSLGASPNSNPALTALLTPSTFPALVTLTTKCDLDANTNLDRLGTFLILSIKRNSSEQVWTLLSLGANPTLGLYAHVYSPLATAVEYGASLEMVEMLLQAGATVRGSDALHVAAMKGRVDVLRRLLLADGVDVNEIGFEYCAEERLAQAAGSALHFAVDGGSVEAVRLLLANGADRELKDVQGRAPIGRAKRTGDKGIIALLEGQVKHGER